MSFTFLRWLRQGAAAAVIPAEGGTGATPRPSFWLGVELTAHDKAGASTMTPAAPTLQLFGPGDVIGIDPRQVVRTVPERGASAFEPGHFPHVEFDRPDLPWMFSPFRERPADPDPQATLAADGRLLGETLTPWLCLVVVEQLPDVAVTPAAPLPVLTLPTLDALPPLSQAHAWAHVQLVGEVDRDAVRGIVDKQPARTVSRLICPRRLRPGTRYHACVVPTYRAGREAGLGQPVDPATALEPAWAAKDKLPLRLPVYHHWEFATASSGDFRTLVERLERQTSLGDVGLRTIDVSDPGFGMPTATSGAGTADLDGALRPDGMPPAEGPASFAAAIGPILDQQQALVPPLYGRWHAARQRLPAAGTDPGWLRELNAEPARRVAAGLGTQVVQENQEALMAAAWEQVGEIERANQRLRQGQLALAASQRLHDRHLSRLLNAADPVVLALAGPALGRIRAGANTVQAEVMRSCLPVLAVCGGFRRVTRPRGPLMRRLGRRADVPTLGALLARLGEGGLRDQPPPAPPRAAVLPTLTLDRLINAPDLLEAAGLADRHDEGNAAFRQLLRALRQRATPAACQPVQGATLDAVRAGLEPTATIPARVHAQVKLPPGRTHRAGRIDEVMAAPEIPAPMSLPLIKLGQDWLLPNMADVPLESIALLTPNWAFIEAYMAGLNHEMARELLWRAYPTDQRGTVFRHFWDRAGAAKTPDIEPVHRWDEKLALGAHGSHPADGPLVLLIRGELLRRYPRATVFMQQARLVLDDKGVPRRRPDGELERVPVSTIDAQSTEFPAFSGRLEPDITFLGFDVGAADARGDGGKAGRFVAFQEQPTEPRFGLAETATKGTGPWTWRELSWDDVKVTAGGYLDVDATSRAAVHAGMRPAQLGLTPAWDGRADTLAGITLNPAFRLFVHASDLLPPPP